MESDGSADEEVSVNSCSSCQQLVHSYACGCLLLRLLSLQLSQQQRVVVIAQHSIIGRLQPRRARRQLIRCESTDASKRLLLVTGLLQSL